ncbi:MAG: hypothetical protein M5U12_33245 [Verrucomicrobia bacterium]|nr:hypothetical protein [Verrucomicrobiota bacterium]
MSAVAFLCAVMMTASAQPLTGGSYVLVGAVATGAGAATGWPYSLSAWVPTEGAGRSAGGEWDLTAGLLGLYGPADDGVWLHVERTASGSVRLWWPEAITGYQLEFTPHAGPGGNLAAGRSYAGGQFVHRRPRVCGPVLPVAEAVNRAPGHRRVGRPKANARAAAPAVATQPALEAVTGR